MTRLGTIFSWGVFALAAGCGSTPEVPTFDRTGNDPYARVPFKDHAPANVPTPVADFPTRYEDATGGSLDLTEYRGKNKVVVVVLRGVPRTASGAFCPSCLAQVNGLLVNRDEFRTRNVRVLIVFPGPTDRLPEFLETTKFPKAGQSDISFRVLVDKECDACGRLGIRDDLAKPSTFVLDTNGNVVYAYVGETSTDRPSLKAILQQLDRCP